MNQQQQTALQRGCGPLLAIPVVLVIVFVVGLFVNANQEAEWEAQSGTSPVALQGTVENKSWRITSAVLETNAEYHTTELVIQLERKRSPGIGGLPRINPDIVVSVGGTSCQRISGRLYSETLSLSCRAFLPLERIREIDAVTVDFLGR